MRSLIAKTSDYPIWTGGNRQEAVLKWTARSESRHSFAKRPAIHRLRLNPGWSLVAALSLLPIVFWVAALPVGARFQDSAATLKSFANITALVGTAGFALNLLLGARLGFVERLFGGLDRLYRAHRFVGCTSLLLLFSHALLLAFGTAAEPGSSAIELFLPSAGWSIFVGVIALFGMVAALILTVLVRLKHEIFVYVQRSFGLLFLVASFHVFGVEGTKADSRALTVYMGALSTLAIAAFVYRSVLGRHLVWRYGYRVAEVNHLDRSLVEIVLAPRGKPMPFEPGQFVFVSILHKAVGREAHPFSIASSANDPNLRIVVKALGDYTTALMDLELPASAKIEGPYGRFSYRRVANPHQVWIAGGIGVTPFLSMARSLDPTDHWIDLYYCTERSDQAHFLAELFEIGERHPNLRVIPIRTRWLGHITAEDIRGVSGDLATKDFLICGPPVMVENLKTQFLRSGVSREQIHYEDFGFMGSRRRCQRRS
jgi:predicted ferric reductase